MSEEKAKEDLREYSRRIPSANVARARRNKASPVPTRCQIWRYGARGAKLTKRRGIVKKTELKPVRMFEHPRERNT